MTKRIFRYVLLVSFLVLIISFVLTMGVLYEYSEDRAEQQLKSELVLASQAVDDEGAAYLDALEPDQGLRITWIAADGSVLYDSQESDTEGMENHMEREEVREALQTGYGESRRYSSTLMEQLLYAAGRLDDGTVLRLSVSRNSVFGLALGMMQPLIIILFLALVLSAVSAHLISNRIVRPVNNIDLDNPLDNSSYDELSPLLQRIYHQQIQLGAQKDDLKRKQDELSAVLDNMQEGMIILKEDGSVISINDAARNILKITDVQTGSPLTQMTRNFEIAQLIKDARSGAAGERIVLISGRQYQVTANPVRESRTDAERGITIVLFDVTEREKAEQMRREFTANVSHELKTPLHSISGYAELIKDGLAGEADVAAFAGKIYHEAQRMNQMIQDIITLSHMDEGADDVAFEKTDLYECASDAVSRLQSEAEEKNVTVSLHGEKTLIDAKPPLIRQIITNLCDNAIKYNRPGGKVDVSVGLSGDTASISVSDTGVGIPEADQKRVFERFYRVDKSHSRELGGTGLGLSIVKHAVMIHHGTVSMDSAPGKGTTVTVSLPADHIVKVSEKA